MPNRLFKPVSAFTRNHFVDTLLVFMVAELADSLCGIIDGIFIGRFLGTTAIAAHGIASPVFVFLCIFSYLLTTAFQQMGTIAIGKGKLKEANGLFNLAMAVTAGIALLVLVIGLLAPHSFARLLGADNGPVGEMTVQYLEAVFLGTPALLLFLVLVPVLQLDGKWNLVRIGSIVMAVSDVLIDYLNVTVFHGGMFGMGLATSISYLLGLGVLLTYFFHKDRLFHFNLADMKGLEVNQFLSAGMPAGLRVASRALAIILIDKMVMASGGETAMAAMGVQRNLSYMLLSIPIGISGAVLMFSGISYGEKDRGGLVDVMRLANRWTFGFVGIASILFLFVTPLVVSLYMPGTVEAFRPSVHAVSWYALSMPVMTWNRNLGSYMQGIGKNGMANLIFISCELLMLCGMGVILEERWGAEGIFAAFFFSQLLLTILLQFILWLKRDRRQKGLEAFLCVPEDFGVEPENRLSRLITKQEEVWALSEEVVGFCKERGVSADRAYWVSMYIEEMGNLVVIYGFADKKPHKLEIRLSLDRDEIILRFQDDCHRFDIREKAASWREDPEHPETSLAIQMVMQACKRLIYNNSLNSNNLMIVL